MSGWNFDQFFNNIKNGLADLAKQEVPDFLDEATADGQAFLESMKEDLLTWSQQVLDGKLSRDEFAFLVQGRQDLAKMEGLTKAGATAIQMDQLKNSVIQLVINSAQKLG